MICNPSDELVSEWSSSFVDGIVRHESSHAVCFYATGAKLKSISVGPGLRSDNADYVGVVRCAKPPFNRLPGLLAGEVGESIHDRRPFDFHRDECRYDRDAAQKIIDQWYGKPISEIESTPLFKMSVDTAQRILSENSLAVSFLCLKLKRHPFCLEADEIESFMVRMNVRNDYE